MRMIDIIGKKRDKMELTKQEINFFIDGYVKDKIPDYQIASILMAIYINGMSDREITDLTMAMANSGDIMDLSSISGIKVDKHSTGGVGDKTSIIIGPMVAACGVSVAKMAGRGLGYTGGTIDKLESIPGFKTQLSQYEFMKIVNDIGVSIVSQSGILAPADKKIYALRDVTATVESIPLITASVMSKKIASGCDAILLDVKTGKGAFMKTEQEAVMLAKKMVSIGKMVNKKIIALITDMEQPLGTAIGNTLEIIESIETLKGRGTKDLTELCICLASNMVYLAGKGTIEECIKMVKDKIKSGEAFKKLIEMVKAQGGDQSYIEDICKFEKAKFIYKVNSQQSGYINKINAELCGLASVILGSGRNCKDDNIDYLAGIILKSKVGDYVNKGDIIMELHTNQKDKIDEAKELVLQAVSFSDRPSVKRNIVLDKIL